MMKILDEQFHDVPTNRLNVPSSLRRKALLLIIRNGNPNQTCEHASKLKSREPGDPRDYSLWLGGEPSENAFGNSQYDRFWEVR
jgi:hypothetical protein